jgi:AcrR family transcriptional regulator
MTKSDKETAILEATLDLIAERGFHNTPMSQIAKQSGVSAGIIYHYFDNKEALIYELYRDIKKRYMEGLLPQADNLGWAETFEQIC